MTVGDDNMRRDPQDLYELDPAVPDLDGVPLLHHLDGFIDAGAAGRLLAEHLLGEGGHETIARFDVDRLIDYRSRRPTMTFAADRWESYEEPELAVRLLRDASGAPFLLLTGPEPDHEWELFTAAVRSVADRVGAGLAVGFQGVPMGVPHTRPLGVIAYATRPELVTTYRHMPGRLQVPGSASALLELRLGAAGRDAAGFAAQVPHYLAQSVYPAASLKLLESVGGTAGLDLPAGELREASERTNAEIDRQVSDSAEVAELIRRLERQYDEYAEAGRDGAGGEGLLAGQEIPTADELGAQFERFLAEQQGRGGDSTDR
jgi:hypothetical protein